MMVKDCPEFFYIFWGAIKAGFVPVPLNTLLRAKDYQFMIEDSGCAAVIYSPEYEGEVGPALAAANRNRITSMLTEGEGSIRRVMADASDELRPCPRRSMMIASGSIPRARPGVPKAPFMRIRYSRYLYSLRGRCPRHYRRRYLFLGGQAVLCLWARQRHDLSVMGWRDRGVVRAPTKPGDDIRGDRDKQGDDLFRRADALCGAASGDGKQHAGPVFGAGLCIGG